MAHSCDETSGILFRKPCTERAVAKCGACKKRICARHGRGQSAQFQTCISCLRKRLEDSSQRSSLGWLRDDPYFYWYYQDEAGGGQHYQSEDYALFDGSSDASSEPLSMGGPTEHHWEGS